MLKNAIAMVQEIYKMVRRLGSIFIFLKVASSNDPNPTKVETLQNKWSRFFGKTSHDATAALDR